MRGRDDHGMDDHSACSSSQAAMMHRLPRARVVDRTEYLTSLARGRSVIHVGFVDAGFRAMQDRSGAWLHEHLASSAGSLIGIDVDELGVEQAKAEGYEAYVLDCRDEAAVAELALERADLVIAGEVLEHVDDTAGFLRGLHALVRPSGTLVVTVPNATGLLNTAAALVGREVQHPDHIATYTWRTLAQLLARHGWRPTEVRTFVRPVKTLGTDGLLVRVLAFGARLLQWFEVLLGRLGKPFLAEGLIVVNEPVPGD